MPFDWEQYIEPYDYEPVTQAKSGFWGSLWDTTKNASSQVFQSGVDIYKQYVDVRYQQNPTALVYREPQRSLPPSPDYVMSTPYFRDNLGNAPAEKITEKIDVPFISGISKQTGISPTIIMLGIGALALFFLTKK